MQIQKHIVSWAEARPDIRLILVIGSRARRVHPADAWSDLDLEIFSTDVDVYRSGTDWLAEIGPVWTSVPFDRSDGYLEYLVLFGNDEQADFAFYPVADLPRRLADPVAREIYQRGYAVLLDKDGLRAQLAESFSVPYVHERLSQESFRRVVHGFWLRALSVAQAIRRRELWVVKEEDTELKRHLLNIIELQTHLQHGWDYDTWHDGRFLAEWTDEQTLRVLRRVFGHFDAADSWRALLATMDLFRHLAVEAAPRLGYPYPVELDEHVTQLVRRLHAQDDLSQ
jgi:aminoglycoside 6-adenylyltransferase